MNDHDKIVRYIADNNAASYDVLLGARVGDYTPDLILMTKTEPKRVVFVIEVGIENDLNDKMQKWSKNNIKGGTFYIIVQPSKVELAKQLAAANGIKAKFGYYTINQANQIEKVTYEP